MKFKNLAKILCVCSLFADVTYASGASLWGDIDVPAQDVSVTPLTPAPVAQKTVCEVLAQKAELGNDVINSSKMQNDLKNMASSVKPEYTMILSDPIATKTLYKIFREQYLQQNCKK